MSSSSSLTTYSHNLPFIVKQREFDTKGVGFTSGVFYTGTIPIPPNTALWMSHIVSSTSTPTMYTIQITPQFHILPRHDLDAMVNHSCEPNIVPNISAFHASTSQLQWISLKTIFHGDELMFDYEHTEGKLKTPFTCECGSATCKKRIVGHSFRGLPL